MRVSVLRAAACTGVLICALVLGTSGAALAGADPSEVGHDSHQRESSKAENRERPSLNRIIHRIFSEHSRRPGNESRRSPRAKIGSDPVSGSTASESNAETFSEPAEEPTPDVVPDDERGADPGGSDQASGGGGGGDVGATTPAPSPPVAGGSDYGDNSVVAAVPDEEKKQAGSIVYPYPFYWLELGNGGDWWNVKRVMSRLGDAFHPQAATTRTPEPEPEPAPAPAFRGPAPEAPAPDPVLDASGGVVAGGGSDYRADGFGGSPVLSAPIVGIPAPPPAAARFPAFPAAPAATPGLGSAARGATAEQAPTTVSGGQQGSQPLGPTRPVTEIAGQTPRRGYTDYLRNPSLPRLAGAALPGVAGILLMTLGGGVIGYRQAEAGRVIRSTGAARYLP